MTEPSRWSRLIADETAHHFDALMDLGIARDQAVLLTAKFHEIMCQTVMMDEQFKPVVKSMLGPVSDRAGRGPKGASDEDSRHA